MSESSFLFDSTVVRQHRARAEKDFAKHRFLFDDCAAQLQERLSEVKRDFLQVLDLSPFSFWGQRASIAGDAFLDEKALPFATESFDLVVSNLGLHWVNDVPGALAQIRAVLKSEGLFIGSLIGGQSLCELRACFLDAELAVTGGVSPRTSPMIDLQTASQLMQRAGFKLPVADKETVTLLYSDMFALMRDLRGMGQTNAHSQRLRHPTRRAVFFEAARLYHERFADVDGHIPATFEILYLHGWE